MGRFDRMVESIGAAQMPDAPGFYWVNDTSAYGWEPVQVIKKFGTHGELRIMRCGVEGDSAIEPWLKEWVRIEQPR